MLRVVFVLLVTAASMAGVAAPQPPQTVPTSRPPTMPARDARADKPATGVIKGRVTTADGRPLRRAQVRASAPELKDTKAASSDTDGYYELTELPAGRYTVRVTRGGYVPIVYGQRFPGDLQTPLKLGDGETIDKVDVVMPRASVIAGRVLDELGEPIADVNVLALQMRFFQGRRRLVPISMMNRTDDAGQFRLVGLLPGEYYVQAVTRESWVVAGKERTVMGFAPTFYPSAADATAAVRLKVGLGQEVAGTDITLLPIRTANISGVALGAGGAPLVGGRIALSQEFRGPGSMSTSMVASATAAADGAFRFANIAPGEYRITARGAAAGADDGATQMVTLHGADIDGLVLAASSGGVIAGRVVVENETPLPIPLSRLRVVARAVDGAVATVSASASNGAVRDDGTFELANVVGLQRLTIAGVPDGWGLKSIDREGGEIADTDISMRSGERWDGVQVVLTNRLATLTGTVSVDRTEQRGTGTIIVFNEDASLWGDASRHVKAARPNQTGEFEVAGLLPGRYFAIAVEYIQEGDWQDPEVLASLRDRATRVILGEAETKPMRLPLSR